MLHEFSRCNVRVVDRGTDCITDLAQIVWRHIGCHTDSNTTRTIHEQIWHLRRKYRGFFQGLVKVRDKVNGILVDVAKQFFGDLFETDLGISHRCC